MRATIFRFFAQFPTLESTGSPCSSGGGVDLFGLPTWYQYLDCGDSNTPSITEISDVWNIGWAVFEIILYVGGLLAVVFIAIYGIEFIVSQGKPDKIAKARTALIYAVIGLALSIVGRAVIQLIYNAFEGGASLS